mmetsp:Transcript_2152/g.2471  ORF Transcript_2152/g.2471 Transcript_2152/m.2471 type:complete len:109 (+) Transcript_2152:181-507(+)
MHTESIGIGEYEALRKNDRRFFHELKIPKDVRFKRLKDAGWSTREILTAIRAVTKYKTKRRQTNKQTLCLARRQERNETITRAVRNFFTNNKKKERAYIEHALSFTNA